MQMCTLKSETGAQLSSQEILWSTTLPVQAPKDPPGLPRGFKARDLNAVIGKTTGRESSKLPTSGRM